MKISIYFSCAEVPIYLDLLDEDTVEALYAISKDALKVVDPSIAEYFILVWGGQALDPRGARDTRLSILGMFDGTKIHAIPVPEPFLPDQVASLIPRCFDIERHYDARQEQNDVTTLIQLVKSFLEWARTPESSIFWKPDELDLCAMEKAIEELDGAHPGYGGTPRHIKFFGQYGCALISTGLGANQLVNLDLICLDGWEWHVHKGRGGYQHAASPDLKETKVLHVGSVKASSFEQFLHRTQHFLQVAEDRKGSKRRASERSQGHQKTPAFLKAVMSDALNEIDTGIEQEEGTVTPKGGFTDVGIHTGGQYEETAWPLLCAVLIFLTGKRSFTTEFLLELRLRLVEGKISTISPAGKDFSQLAYHVDIAMLALREVVIAATTQHFDPDLRFEARCQYLNYEIARILDKWSITESKKSEFDSSDFEIRPFEINPPPEKSPRPSIRTREEILKLAVENILSLPLPSCFRRLSLNNARRGLETHSMLFDHADLSELSGWINSKAIKDKYSDGCHGCGTEFMACRTAETITFGMIAGENFLDEVKGMETYHFDVAERCKEIKLLVEGYRFASKVISQDSSCSLKVESKSREVLFVWCCFCYVHALVHSTHRDLMEAFGPALDGSDLQHLVLSDKLAVCALGQVVMYLRQFAAKSPVFSLRPNDATITFAHSFAKKHMLDMWQVEKERATARSNSHWNTIRMKQQSLVDLDDQLATEVKALESFKDQKLRSGPPRHHGYNATSYENYRRYSEADRGIKLSKHNIEKLKSRIRREESAPPGVLQPLPRGEDAALPILFFLNMPLQFQVLSWLTFSGQQLLLPQDDLVIGPCVPLSNSAQFAIPKIIASKKEPATLWRTYYKEQSTYGSKTQTAVILGSDMLPPRDASWYETNVRHYNHIDQGVWYPDSLRPILFWNGGDFPLDKCRTHTWFNPFAQGLRQVRPFQFAESLDDASVQWAVSQLGAESSTCRGSWPIASQKLMRKTFIEKEEILWFGTIRAYPFQQYRKLICILREKKLPLDLPLVRQLLLQTLLQVGPFDLQAKHFLWRTDLSDRDGWSAIGDVLLSLFQALRNKMRSHTSLVTLALVSAFASEWNSTCRVASRTGADIAKSWAENTAAQFGDAKPDEMATLRARCCVFNSYALLCMGGDWDANDAREACKLVVLVHKYGQSAASSNFDKLIEILAAYVQELLARKLIDYLRHVNESTDILTDAVNLVFTGGWKNLHWTPVQMETVSTCFQATTPSGSLLTINILNGIVLFDGLPPKSLPRSVTTLPLYARTFGVRNFEVFEDEGIFKTTEAINGRKYWFYLDRSGDLIAQEHDIASGDCFELLGRPHDGWGEDLPTQLQQVYSHWICRNSSCIVFRPEGFLRRDTILILCSEEGSHWICRQVPALSEKLSLSPLLTKSSAFPELKAFSGGKGVVAALQRLEHDIRLVHCKIYQNDIYFELPRFGLEFSFSRDGRCLSTNFEGYELKTPQNLTGTLYGFQQYLTLSASTKIDIILVPVGQVVDHGNSVSIELSRSCTADLHVYVYEIHPRFLSIEPKAGCFALSARLQLAALHVATGTSLLETRYGQTGSERAFYLLAQSFESRPFSEKEIQHIMFLFSSEKSTPSISLRCHELLGYSNALSFLHHIEPKASLDREKRTEAINAYRSLKQTSRMSHRSTLSADEESRVMDGFQDTEVASADMPTGKWANLPVVSRKKYDEVLDMISTLVQNDTQATPGNEEFPFDIREIQCSKVGKEIARALLTSWSKHLGVKTRCISPSGRIEDTLRSAKEMCHEARSELESRVVAAFLYFPTDRDARAIRSSLARAANIHPKPGIQDIPGMVLRGSEFILEYNSWQADGSLDCCVHWLELCVLEDTIDRLLGMDVTSSEFPREVDNAKRSWSVHAYPEWLIFEAEQRLQVRDLQYQVARFCIEQPGKITQLNMGEGKTRVILPLLILYLAKEKDSLVRVHFLAPLLAEACQYLCKVLSAGFFAKKLLILRFERSVFFTEDRARILEEYLEKCRKCGALVVLSPEHRLSLSLKALDESTPENVKCIVNRIESLPYIDIFDESDEIFHHKYQLIYAVGRCIPLPAAKERWTATQAVLEVLQHDENVRTLKSVDGLCIRRNWGVSNYGGTFDGLQLLEGNALETSRTRLLTALASAVLADPPYLFRWMQNHPHGNRFQEFICDPMKDLDWLRSSCIGISQSQISQLLSLRGCLAHGLMEHNLQRRYRVDYGVDSRRGKTRRIAVPYRACDNPAARAEFAHPDVIIILTCLSYYNSGLKHEEMLEALQALLKLGPTAQAKEYALWFELALPTLAEKEVQQLDHVNKLDPTSHKQLGVAHRIFWRNMRTINFWLNTCVFPIETMQFPQRLLANACHLASSTGSGCRGFSGTQDNSLLLPPQVEQSLPDIEEVESTDGKMIDILQNNSSVHVLEKTADLPKAVMSYAVSKSMNAIIDCGANMAGLANSEVAAMLTKMLTDIHRPDDFCPKGIVYFDIEKESWYFRDVTDKNRPLGNPYHEKQGLIFFDESRCRGADMKMAADARAIITLSVGMCKDKLMQAAGRMRKLGHGQSITFVVPAEVATKIRESNSTSEISLSTIQKWILVNTVKSISTSLSDWGLQVSYFATTQNPTTRIVDEVLDVETLYGTGLSEGKVDSFVEHTIERDLKRIHERGIGDSVDEKVIKKLKSHLKTYGSDQVAVLTSNEECERELENEREQELEVEKEILHCLPAPCARWDIEKLLGASNPKSVAHFVSILTLRDATKRSYPDSNLWHIEWNSDIFVTSNFVDTVMTDANSLLPDLSDYMRPVDAIVLFSGESGHGEVSSCLLLSEWEADEFLRILSAGEEPSHATFVNMTYLRKAASEGWTKPIVLQVPHRQSERPLRLVDSMMVSLQLYSGGTEFEGEHGKRALVDLLPTFHAKRAAIDLIALRGRSNYVARSDLEEVCELDLLGDDE